MHLSNEKFLKRAKRCVTIMGYNKFYETDTKCMRYKIQDGEEWNEFAVSSYLPWYKYHFSNPKAKNYNVRKYAIQNPLKLKRRDNIIIMTAYHTLLNKRLIIDGCHRAVALDTLHIKTEDELWMPKIEIWECYGSQLHAIFPMDFQHFVINAIKK